ncbi:MAG: NAD(+) synthase [Candidatus Nealsonbacteria bacterium]|nr:NAD(+) synthase [Candidatus Nealsonbacteria bacterium]
MVKRSMAKLKGLTIALCQMKVVPGRPDLNAAYIIEEIKKAKNRGVDIIVFPELCTTGYIVGDIFEDDFFIEDVLSWNKNIIEATRNGVTVVFGTITVSQNQRGEDGRQRKHNTVVTAQNGKVLLAVPKTLQPNYRFFNDDKHFYSSRKIAQEQNISLQKILKPVEVETKIGKVKIGAIVCEDMWHKDYPFNPTKILTDNGAELIINVSASPWTWQKNRKRHQIVKELLQECKIPFVYVNNTGVQNTGKNIIVFDGSSTVYDEKGEIVFDVEPYEGGSYDFKFAKDVKPLKTKPQDDTAELYNAMLCATKTMTPPNKKVLVGLSGGIDSAVVCALLVDALGKDRVMAINMPMPYNSQKTRDFAALIAKNLGIQYEVVPIGEIVEAVCKSRQIEPGTLAYENIQARARREILSTTADGFFVCCSNKTEIAFGYGTLYGDIAGYFAPLGDLVKREVRQIAAYQNQTRFKQKIIPEECINQTPTAELKENQKDPFDYGDLTKRGYHDEMIRAFTEFRKNPEWFIESYLKSKLEEELLLEPGTLVRLFPTPKDFVNDLQHWWKTFHGSYFKRVQCPPIPIFSKRAFGRDLEESLMQPHLTQRYLYLEKYLLSQGKSPKQRVAIFGGSFNPPAMNHKFIVAELSRVFEKVVVVPCGIRTDKPSTTVASPQQRKVMAEMTFSGMPNVQLDFYDLEKNVFTPTYLLQERYAKLFPDSEIWIAVGEDLVAGGKEGNSEIQKSWKKGKEIWKNLKFVVVSQPNKRPNPQDLPPTNELIAIEIILGRSTELREKISKGQSIDGLVIPEVMRYIEEQKLYK